MVTEEGCFTLPLSRSNPYGTRWRGESNNVSHHFPVVRHIVLLGGGDFLPACAFLDVSRSNPLPTFKPVSDVQPNSFPAPRCSTRHQESQGHGDGDHHRGRCSLLLR